MDIYTSTRIIWALGFRVQFLLGFYVDKQINKYVYIYIYIHLYLYIYIYTHIFIFGFG